MSNSECDVTSERENSSENRLQTGHEADVVRSLNLLVNPHEHIKVVPKNKWAIVKGQYTYYHYGQEFDDHGWGCAYRAFQTVVSWFRFQDIDRIPIIPTHRDIQQCLVNIEDKPSSFVGSRQWIGSLELSYCLETLYGINSRILSSNSGTELAEHSRALIFHFENGGAPVMIGGGQLAHTILGIDYNVRSGKCEWLILDPHYSGPESIETIIEKGWCGWKSGSFWDKKSFYNLLVPINPTPNIQRTD